MAKKKRQARGQTPRRRPRANAGQGAMPQLPDRRVLEEVMRQALGDASGGAPGSPQARAREILHEAFQTEDPERQVELARKALAIDPDSADAYVLMAENTPNFKESLQLYEQGVAAGERALGERAFREDVGHFWGLLETRPYMRARLGLAYSLWTSGHREDAVRHLQDMLRLNPGDNQGVRYTLAGFLLNLDRDEELARLLEQYDEDSAAWAYTKTLLAFRRHGDTPEARRLLKEARKSNKHVLPYLLGEKFPSMEMPNAYSPGDEREALNYIGSFLAGWKATPGAIAWLREAGKTARKKRPTEPAPQGPLPLVKQRLQKLRQEHDVWQADARQLAMTVQEAGVRTRPWLVLVTSRENDLVLGHFLAGEEPSADCSWDTLADAMERPLMGKPHRPTELQIPPDGPWQTLRPHLEEVGVQCVAADDLDQLDHVFEGLAEHMGGGEPPGLVETPGVTPEQVGRFFDAAASFYQEAPWRRVGYEGAIQVECDKFESGPWYAVLMGQSGLTHGLAVYDDLDVLQRLWAGTLSDEENARLTVATTLTYGDDAEIPLADVEAARRYGWKVARPDAFPSIFRKERGMSMRSPLAWELELMEGCLRAIPEFVKRHRQDDPTRETMRVPAAGGELTLSLSWVQID